MPVTLPLPLPLPAARDAAVTVFELAGLDRHGLLAAVLQLLVVNGCEVLSAAVSGPVLSNIVLFTLGNLQSGQEKPLHPFVAVYLLHVLSAAVSAGR